jgi:hypothetical protein
MLKNNNKYEVTSFLTKHLSDYACSLCTVTLNLSCEVLAFVNETGETGTVNYCQKFKLNINHICIIISPRWLPKL